MSLQPSRPVVIVPYDSRWPGTFEALRLVYSTALAGVATAIEHVGSTAVPGLAAKPVIDVDVAIATRDVLPEVIRRLTCLGYHHEGDLGVAGREAFSTRGAENVPRDGKRRSWPAHHLYVCAADCREFHRHLLFRDWLRRHPATVLEYADLKRRLAESYRDDRDGYTEAKTEFIESTMLSATHSTR
jgi:GrpB-like predicted nucleotidyltransferase (UPF0157 family)